MGRPFSDSGGIIWSMCVKLHDTTCYDIIYLQQAQYRYQKHLEQIKLTNDMIDTDIRKTFHNQIYYTTGRI